MTAAHMLAHCCIAYEMALDDRGDRDLDMERGRLINYITTAQGLGDAYFNGKESISFGALTGAVEQLVPQALGASPDPIRCVIR